MASACLRCWCVVLGLAALSRLTAQEPAPAGEAPRVPSVSPVLRGLNLGVTVAGVHDSSIGWYNVVTPAASYAFSPRYSADLSLSVYPYRLTENASDRLVFTGGDTGDTLLEAHATFNPAPWRDIATASMTFPTGNRVDGLGTGKVTFNLDNRIERYFGQTGFLVDIGGGDSSGLVNRLVTEDDSSLGPLAQFQAGLVTWLTSGVALQSLAYEQLPIGDQKTYTTIVRPGFPPMTVPTGRRVNEDNGFTNSLFIPLTSHIMLGSSYNRSLRLHLDTVSVGLTFLLHGSDVRRDSLIDKAMREAERGATTPHLPVP